MDNWIDFVVDANPIHAVFGNDIPTLRGVELHELILHRDGPRAILRLDLQEFPRNPPKKWVAGGLNRVQLKLIAVGVHDLVIIGLQASGVIDLSVIKASEILKISYENSLMKLDMKADALVIDGISAYVNNKY